MAWDLLFFFLDDVGGGDESFFVCCRFVAADVGSDQKLNFVSKTAKNGIFIPSLFRKNFKRFHHLKTR